MRLCSPQPSCRLTGPAPVSPGWSWEGVEPAEVPANMSPNVSRPLSGSPLVRVKEEPPSPPRTPWVEEASPRHPSSVDTPLSPTALIDSILRESEPAPTSATAPTDAGGRAPSSPPRLAPEKCLSVACLDK